MRPFFGLVLLAWATAAVTVDRPVIRTGSDLPPVRFAVSVPASTLLGTPAFTAMLPELRAEAERLLRDYEIKDNTIVQQLRLGLANVAVLEGRGSDATRLFAAYREGEVKPQLKLLGGFATDIAIAEMSVTQDRRCTAAAARLKASVTGADATMDRDQFLHPFAEVQEASLPSTPVAP